MECFIFQTYVPLESTQSQAINLAHFVPRTSIAAAMEQRCVMNVHQILPQQGMGRFPSQTAVVQVCCFHNLLYVNLYQIC